MNKLQKGDENFVSVQDRIKYRKERAGKVKRIKMKIGSLRGVKLGSR